MKDAWGPYDFYRDFNVIFPEQFKLDYSYLLGSSGLIGSPADEDRATKIGIRVLYRTIDEDDPQTTFDETVGDYRFQTVLYLTYQF